MMFPKSTARRSEARCLSDGAGLQPWARRESSPHFQLLARESWQRTKGKFVRRTVRRIASYVYSVAAGSMVSNTGCTALWGGTSTCRSSVAVPT